MLSLFVNLVELKDYMMMIGCLSWYTGSWLRNTFCGLVTWFE